MKYSEYTVNNNSQALEVSLTHQHNHPSHLSGVIFPGGNKIKTLVRYFSSRELFTREGSPSGLAWLLLLATLAQVLGEKCLRVVISRERLDLPIKGFI